MLVRLLAALIVWTVAIGMMTAATARGGETAAGEGVDFAEFITAATVSKRNADGEWEPVTSVTEGDEIRVGIDYLIPADTVTAAHRTITYQLPEGVRPIAEQTGGVDYNGTVIGAYTIGEDGLIAITFNEAFSDGEDFSGTIAFQGAARLVGDGDDGVIHFGDAFADVTVEPRREDEDLTVKKTGSAVRGSDGAAAVISYTVTASSEHGTGANGVTLKDRLQYAEGSVRYDTSSIKVTFVGADGTRRELPSSDYAVSYESQTLEGVSGPSGLTVEGLPALAAGERYELSYDVIADSTQADGSLHVQNMGGADAGDLHPWAWHEERLDRVIGKSGYHDSSANVIVWRIDIANTCVSDGGAQRCDDLGGRTLTDVIGTAGVQAAPSDTFTVRDHEGAVVATGNTADLLSGGYTFPAGSTSASYSIEYRTTVPSGQAGQTQQVTNAATFDGYRAEGSVNVTERDWNVAKTHSGEQTRDDGLTSSTWRTTVSIPASWDGLTLQDTILPAQNTQGGGLPIALRLGPGTRR